MEKVVLFRVGSERFAVPVDRIQSIEKVPELTLVPYVPAFVKGITSLRGQVIPVIDLAERFSYVSSASDQERRMLVVSTRDAWVGLLVDAAQDVIDVQDDARRPAPRVGLALKREFLLGVLQQEEQLIMILDLDALFTDEEKNAVLSGMEQSK
ncbi:chemotaxis protein CheW [Ferroacidibacillus organovorans]|uniref:CheW-like domain-containing protein n=1 Tax=Ferroacidibacillus organovorans TaxID=1765683 RepID=A0A853KC79_9BACL|nr:chemotaxis protein CheW [Ferroacidibacillus organovorans]KYP82097.1 hypothetical protein AYJ22_00085 [Ferroacidibacillus organovorans]OAG94457.1 hypothetical protein AYW79_05425 [Ferroacidibacillus organovorans]